MSATATDMTRFMMAQLQGGTLGTAQILKPETVALMQSPQYQFDPRGPAACLGFYEESQYGHRIIGHGGDTKYFHTALHLIPDAKIGIFISYNSAGGGFSDLRGALFDKFMSRYFPYTPPSTAKMASAKSDAAQLDGWYMVSRRGQSNGLFLGALLNEVHISSQPNGELVTGGMLVLNGTRILNGADVSWRETAPGLWQDTGGEQFRLFVKSDADGIPTFSSGFPSMEYKRVAWYQTSPFLFTLLTYASCIFLFVLAALPIMALVRYFRRKGVAINRDVVLTRRWLFALALVNVLTWLLPSVAPLVSFAWLDILVRAGKGFGWLAALGTVPAIWIAYRAWRTKELYWMTKIFRSIVCLACLVSVWMAWYGNLLSMHLRY